MPHFNRRALMSSIASAALFAAGPAQALVCDVRREKHGGVSTKSYNCVIDADRSLSATFLRMSDVFVDSLSQNRLPGGYEAVLLGSEMIPTPAFEVFSGLLQDYSYAFEPVDVFVSFDGRQDDVTSEGKLLTTRGSRFRTLGVWDNPGPGVLPFFPLPDELRRAFRNPDNRDVGGFLRYATAGDFERLGDKVVEYMRLWQQQGIDLQERAGVRELGNLDLMEHIRAWEVDGFLPLFFSSFVFGDCGGELYGGAHYAPAGLYVDAMVCRNTGSKPLRIDDFFGAEDRSRHLRPYSSTTPPGNVAFEWKPVELVPGQSVVALQRLLFAAQDRRDWKANKLMRFARAVYGPTHLPKGIISSGQGFPFDGRSHNALLVGSYDERGSCPFLSSWCDRAEDWIQHGKTLTRCDSPERAGEDTREFTGLRRRFKLVEREHERTTLTDATLEIETKSGKRHILARPDGLADGSTTLDIGQKVEFAFDLPTDIVPADVVRSRLRLSGFYEYYQYADFERSRQAARV